MLDLQEHLQDLQENLQDLQENDVCDSMFLYL